jgi:hypothetical protein
MEVVRRSRSTWLCGSHCGGRPGASLAEEDLGMGKLNRSRRIGSSATFGRCTNQRQFQAWFIEVHRVLLEHSVRAWSYLGAACRGWERLLLVKVGVSLA